MTQQRSPASAAPVLDPAQRNVETVARRKEDRERYQTVFAQDAGSVAAPTAGLHFTESLLNQIRSRGVEVCFVTLHVGLGTFRPIQVEDHRQHQMHAEWGELSVEATQAVQACRVHNGRVIAVGTTAVRVLETAAATGAVRLPSGQTSGCGGLNRTGKDPTSPQSSSAPTG